MKTQQKQKIEKHGKELIIFFNLPDQDPISLCKKLHRIENKMHRLAESYCNGDITEEQFDAEKKKALSNLAKIGLIENVFINSDPRGYSLKIKEPTTFYFKDWGGYGIISPDFEGGAE